MDFTPHMHRIIDRIGSDVDVVVGAQHTTVRGVFSSLWAEVKTGHVPAEQATPKFVFKSAAFATTGATDGDGITHAGINYTIIAVLPESDGTTLVRVREY